MPSLSPTARLCLALAAFVALSACGSDDESGNRRRPSVPRGPMPVSAESRTSGTPKATPLEAGETVFSVPRGGREGDATIGEVRVSVSSCGEGWLAFDWGYTWKSVLEGPSDRANLAILLSAGSDLAMHNVFLYPTSLGPTWESFGTRHNAGKEEEITGPGLAAVESRKSEGLTLSGRFYARLPGDAAADPGIAFAYVELQQNNQAGISASDPPGLDLAKFSIESLRPLDAAKLPQLEGKPYETAVASQPDRRKAGGDLRDAVSKLTAAGKEASPNQTLRERAASTAKGKADAMALFREAVSKTPWLIPAHIQVMRQTSPGDLRTADVIGLLKDGFVNFDLVYNCALRMLYRGNSAAYVDVMLGAAAAAAPLGAQHVADIISLCERNVASMALRRRSIRDEYAQATRLAAGLRPLAGDNTKALHSLLFMEFCLALNSVASDGEEAARKTAAELAKSAKLEDAARALPNLLKDAPASDCQRIVHRLLTVTRGTEAELTGFMTSVSAALERFREGEPASETGAMCALIGEAPDSAPAVFQHSWRAYRLVASVFAAGGVSEDVAREESALLFPAGLAEDQVKARRKAVVDTVLEHWKRGLTDRTGEWRDGRMAAAVALLAANGQPFDLLRFHTETAQAEIMHGRVREAAECLQSAAAHEDKGGGTAEEQKLAKDTVRRVNALLRVFEESATPDTSGHALDEYWSGLDDTGKSLFLKTVTYAPASHSSDVAVLGQLMLRGRLDVASRGIARLEAVLRGDANKLHRLGFRASVAELMTDHCREAEATEAIANLEKACDEAGEEARKTRGEFRRLDLLRMRLMVVRGDLDAAEASVKAWLAANAGSDAKGPFETLRTKVEAARKAIVQDEQDRKDEKPDLPLVRMVTTSGTMEIQLYEDDCPNTVGHFLALAESGFHSGKLFHRVVPGFVAQAGGGDGEVEQDLDWRIPLEAVRHHRRGTIAMAREGPDSAGPEAQDSAGSDFYFTLTDISGTHLDGGYAAFGRVTAGLEVLRRVNMTTRIERVEVIRKRSHPYSFRHFPPIFR